MEGQQRLGSGFYSYVTVLTAYQALFEALCIDEPIYSHDNLRMEMLLIIPAPVFTDDRYHPHFTHRKSEAQWG